MSDNKNQKITASSGFFQQITTQGKLILRLMGDRRVSPWLKLLPIGTLAYFVIPDLVIGPIDDMVIIWLGTYLFVELCPPEVVEEHKRALNQVVSGEWKDAPSVKAKPGQAHPSQEQKLKQGEVVDAEYWDKSEENPPDL